MKVFYSKDVDILQIVLSDAPVKESDEDRSGIINDYDDNGNPVGIEILDASKHVSNPQTMEYSVQPTPLGKVV